MYDEAKVKMRKRVHIDQVPPWKQQAEMFMSCYRQKRHVFIDGDRES